MDFLTEARKNWRWLWRYVPKGSERPVTLWTMLETPEMDNDFQVRCGLLLVLWDQNFSSISKWSNFSICHLACFTFYYFCVFYSPLIYNHDFYFLLHLLQYWVWYSARTYVPDMLKNELIYWNMIFKKLSVQFSPLYSPPLRDKRAYSLLERGIWPK